MDAFLPDTILALMPFVDAGVSVRVGACNPDSTDPNVADYLARRGVEVFDGRRICCGLLRLD